VLTGKNEMWRSRRSSSRVGPTFPEQHGTRFTDTLRAGEVSLHSDLLLHGSRANRSSRRRAGLTIRDAAGEVGAVPDAG
jgi:hypothetical protein